MRAHQFINESVTFSVARLVEPKTFSGAEWWEKVEAECPSCEGTGKEKWGDDTEYRCMYCDGKGKVKQTKSLAPELNVSNANAHVVLNILGIHNYDDELMGHIPQTKFPELQRRLLLLKNKIGKSGQFTRPTIQHKQSKGPTMIDVGLSNEQIKHYIEKLQEIIKFAQDTHSDNIYLTWV